MSQRVSKWVDKPANATAATKGGPQSNIRAYASSTATADAQHQQPNGEWSEFFSDLRHKLHQPPGESMTEPYDPAGRTTLTGPPRRAQHPPASVPELPVTNMYQL